MLAPSGCGAAALWASSALCSPALLGTLPGMTCAGGGLYMRKTAEHEWEGGRDSPTRPEPGTHVRGLGARAPFKAPPPPCVTFRRVVVSLRGPGQSPILPFACCVGSLRSVGRCGRCSCWCRFRVRGAQRLVRRGCAGCGGMCRLRVSGAQ